MLAFNNDPTLKTFILSELAKHREADDLVKGKYWEGGKGCAVGCTLEAVRARSGAKSISHDSHMLYEKYLGIPQIIARLEDGIFERLPNGKSQAWPERFTNAIKPGADLSGVWPKFAVWLLVDQQDGVIRFAKNEKTRKTIQAVADAYVRGEKDVFKWKSLRAAAYAAYAADAAAYAAYAAYAAAAYTADAADAAYAAAAYTADADDAYAAAAYTAYAAAAYTAATAAAYAAYAAAAAAGAAAAAYTADAACTSHYEKMADKLIELLETA